MRTAVNSAVRRLVKTVTTKNVAGTANVPANALLMRSAGMV